MKTVKPTKDLLNQFSRDELRAKARSLKVPVGRDKHNTIANLANSGKVVCKLNLTKVQ